MIAPTKIYNDIPTLSPEGAADLIAEAIIYKPPCIAMGLCAAEEVLHAVEPRNLQVINEYIVPHVSRFGYGR
jgi:hypothetical protein